jgi:hypothetical protein
MLGSSRTEAAYFLRGLLASCAFSHAFSRSKDSMVR